ncbi:MAG: hypothetical protein A3H59_03915 [Candidatus Jacksonbacteria bacterium RIFCSPLOWO2_02_FULL_43_9]|nr:MAG: Lipoprotein signal peptidase [Parcubacteria group bacterium GW2011_GWA2_43_13]OGY69144.1 MAG: hypothetical protein A3B94_03670 [Candidatus Jacksonbacteria bacterium RIFCSPHIGHO2_02_FULL_43_10]OGY70163.1 MAG: hypothetical protein A2986_03615 [Candidatus Jacksonbacteria bacterium RIFCSPLOWO2_01_FULL_44_13]OGY72576.1 MAG: hypothetical protein A3H59_03915 [Candidatus Jacksonbacteria bacterium RIFCSPLOWO2_02_FULL_43_9]HAZ16722.1 hypothetical protein [Candidatus Jacksonbacteria bacterium]
MRKSFISIVIVSSAGALLVLDQVIKLAYMTSPIFAERFWIFGPASLNMFLPFGIPFSDVAFWILAVVVWVICWIWFFLADRQYERVILFFILFAGASNLYDRVRWGGVVDYIHIAGISVVNMADIIIVGAVIALIMQRLKSKK